MRPLRNSAAAAAAAAAPIEKSETGFLSRLLRGDLVASALDHDMVIGDAARTAPGRTAAVEARRNELDGSYYFDQAFALKTCSNDVHDALLGMCAEAERMPGINVDHWPWQGHSLNLRKRGFSGDWMLGPYGWSGQNKK